MSRQFHAFLPYLADVYLSKHAKMLEILNIGLKLPLAERLMLMCCEVVKGKRPSEILQKEESFFIWFEERMQVI